MKKPICVHTMYVLTMITTNNSKSSQVWKIQQLPHETTLWCRFDTAGIQLVRWD